jgi:sulfatase maturation enzyme AslB (radical SAM superfamily)
LAGLKLYPSSAHFAWDDPADEDKVMKGIEILKEHGIKTSMFYVLVGYNSTFTEDLYRLEKLKSVDQRAYVMRYETVRGNREYDILAAWANQPSFFMKMTFEEFKVERLKLYKKDYAKKEADVFKFK